MLKRRITITVVAEGGYIEGEESHRGAVPKSFERKK
jgi:hypothetical protein